MWWLMSSFWFYFIAIFISIATVSLVSWAIWDTEYDRGRCRKQCHPIASKIIDGSCYCATETGWEGVTKDGHND